MNNFFKSHKVKILKEIDNFKFSSLLFNIYNYLGSYFRLPLPIFFADDFS